MGKEGVPKTKAGLILDEYMSGTLDPAIKERVDGWITEKGCDYEKESALQDVFAEYQAKYPKPSIITLRAWNRRCKQLGFKDRIASRLLLYKRIVRFAAVITPLCIAGLSLYILQKQHGRPEPASASISITADNPVKLNMPCGSVIWLNSRSEIKYDTTEYNRNRHVELNGEAFFSVEPSEGNPFTVVAGGMTVTVRGTEFNIKAIEDGSPEVSLYSGSVEVKAGNERVTMNPGETLRYNRDDGSLLVEDTAEECATGWHMEIVLDNTSLYNALQMIGERFSTTMVIDESIDGAKLVKARIREKRPKKYWIC